MIKQQLIRKYENCGCEMGGDCRHSSCPMHGNPILPLIEELGDFSDSDLQNELERRKDVKKMIEELRLKSLEVKVFCPRCSGHGYDTSIGTFCSVCNGKKIITAIKVQL